MLTSWFVIGAVALAAPLVAGIVFVYAFFRTLRQSNAAVDIDVSVAPEPPRHQPHQAMQDETSFGNAPAATSATPSAETGC